jgi:hypothetical protein
VILPVFRDDENKEHVEMIVGEVNQFEVPPPCPSSPYPK